MPSLQTLKKREEFLVATKCGSRVTTKGLMVQAVEKGGENMQVGFTVSKKVDKRAVIRNRIKRRLRAVAKDVLPSLGRAGYYYVIIARKAALDRPFEGLVKDLKYALHQLHDGEKA